MKNIKNKLEFIMGKARNIKSIEEFNNEVLIHLKIGKTAISSLGTFYADFEKEEVNARLDGELKTFKFSEVYNCCIIT